jgi:hypothetical protein
MRHVLAVTILGLCLAHPAAAQSAKWPEKGWISINGGVEPATHNYTDAFDLPDNQENEHIAVSYPVKGGTLLAGSGGYRVWKTLTIGAGVTYTSSKGTASISADVPHPFFFNQPRHVDGSTPTTRSEVDMNLLVGWMVPVTSKLRVIVSGGPSAISITQTLVTNIDVAEVFPFDTATFASALTTEGKKTGIGYNAGADVFWMVSRSVGVGAMAQITGATVKETRNSGSGTTSTTISVKAGGSQVGAGIRILF